MRVERSLFHPRPKGTYRIEAKAEDEPTIYLYDEVSPFGVTASAFVADLAQIKAKTIHLRVNSPGGSVFDGLTIYNALKEHPARIIAHVDGLAASIAAVVTMAGNEIHMAENAFLMIHEPYSIVMGGATDLRKEADVLDKVAGQIMGTFVSRTGASEEQVLDWMGAETWFTAAEAEAASFIDAIEPNNGNAKARATLALFDLTPFAHTPDALKDLGPPTKRDLERALRDAGCSQVEAKAILAEGVQAKPRDAVEPTPQAPEVPRDVAPPEGRDPVAVLLGRARIYLATSNPEGN